MKTFLIIIGILIVNYSFAQPKTDDDYVQNFYIACKAKKYTAFNHLSAGTELLDTWQYSRSINRYNKALSIDSNCCDAYYMLAYCYQRQGQLDNALLFCNKSIDKNPNNPSAWIIKGTTQLINNDNENAIIAFENAKKYAPDKIDGYYGLALAYYLQKKYKNGIDIINEFENLESKDATKSDIKKMDKLKSYMSTNP